MKTFWISAKFEVKAKDVFDAVEQLNEIMHNPPELRSLNVNETYAFLADPAGTADPVRDALAA